MSPRGGSGAGVGSGARGGSGRRVLITGLASYWGGRLAQAFEEQPGVDVVVGLDTEAPTVALQKTEFVRTDHSFSILERLVKATRVDTVVHASLIVDSTRSTPRILHERNVIGTLNLLGALGASPGVRTVVVKSSALVYGATARDPVWFAEDTPRSGPARTRTERSLIEAEDYVRDFADDRPEVAVSVLRCANVLDHAIPTPLSRALGLPLVPKLAGFDPLLQLVSTEDVVRAVQLATDQRLEGVFNVAGRGRLPWSEIISIAGKRALPISPWLSSLALMPLQQAGVELPPEVVDLLRYGRGVDTTKIERAGFAPTDTGSAVERFARQQRMRRSSGESGRAYRYQSDVEQFFRHSPAVVTDAG
jgi:UDP-glucose 4-epimerase